MSGDHNMYCSANNKQEPVAWINKTGEYKYLEWNKDVECDDWIPLYTEPQYKDLSDEEIWKLWQQHLNDEIPVFARAVLKKASEK